MTQPHDRPNAQELIQAVSEFLRDEVQDAVDGRVSFHLRVAANALKIAARELQSGAQHATAHEARLAAFDVANDQELSAAIRTGQLDERYDELSAEIRQMVWDKVNVANPRYVKPYTSPNERERYRRAGQM